MRVCTTDNEGYEMIQACETTNFHTFKDAKFDSTAHS